MVGVKVSQELRMKLDQMRIKHRMSFEQIARLTGMSDATIRKVIRKKGTSVRDVHLAALKELMAKYERGEITFGEDRKAATTEAPAA